jgi:hypothetical protein
MIKKMMQGAVLVVAGLTLGGCPLDNKPKTATPVKKPPAADYQAAVPPTPRPANVQAICYNEADLVTIRGRMVQQQFVVAALQCQGAGGVLAFRDIYASFIGKYSGELSTNTRSLQQLAGKKRFNVDVVVTEFANRTAQRAPVDKEFCGRSLRAFEWAMDAKVTSLAQVPPPYDIGPEMNIHPCTAP